MHSPLVASRRGGQELPPAGRGTLGDNKTASGNHICRGVNCSSHTCDHDTYIEAANPADPTQFTNSIQARVDADQLRGRGRSVKWQESKLDRRQIMEAMKIHEYARRLIETHGDKAILQAAQKRNGFERVGDSTQAEIWRRVEAALREMRGPHAS